MKLTRAAGTRTGESECILPTEGSRGRDNVHLIVASVSLCAG